ncbi:MAG: hypothetical protein AAF127_13380 [Pseudomonadota bacterium]
MIAKWLPLLIALGAFAYALRAHWLPLLQDKLPAPKTVIDAPLDRGQIFVWGWSEADLRTILSDFADLYSLDADNLRIRHEDADWLLIVWAEPISARDVQFLVNYLHYPNGFDLDLFDPCAAAIVPIVADNGPPGVLQGVLAKLYVPTDDRDFDCVYAMIEDGDAYRIAFTNHAWVQTSEPRLPELAARAPFEVTAL